MLTPRISIRYAPDVENHQYLETTIGLPVIFYEPALLKYIRKNFALPGVLHTLYLPSTQHDREQHHEERRSDCRRKTKKNEVLRVCRIKINDTD